MTQRGLTRFAHYWGPVLAWMGIIFWMSSGSFSSAETSRIIVPLLRFLFPAMTSGDLDLAHAMIRKSGHIFEYFILGILAFRAFRSGQERRWSLRWAVSAIILSICYAASDEFHQSFVASRGSSLLDVCIDSTGGILSQVTVMLHGKKPWGTSGAKLSL